MDLVDRRQARGRSRCSTPPRASPRSSSVHAAADLGAPGRPGRHRAGGDRVRRRAANAARDRSRRVGERGAGGHRGEARGARQGAADEHSRRLVDEHRRIRVRSSRAPRRWCAASPTSTRSPTAAPRPFASSAPSSRSPTPTKNPSRTSSRWRAQLEAPIFMPLDVARAGDLEAVFERDRPAVGRARHPGALDRLGTEGRPAGRPAQLLGRRFRQGDGHLVPFVRAHGAAGRTVDEERRHDVHDELLRRQQGRHQLQRDGPGEGGPRSVGALSRVRARPAGHPRARDLAGAAEDTRRIGLKDFDLLLNEAAQRAPLGELVDIMDVGFTCAFLATPYARRLSGETLYVDGGVNIMA